MIVLTGATGYIGTLVLARLLARDGPDIVCPVRARDEDHARERMDAVLRNLWREPDPRARVRVREIACDLESPLPISPGVASEVTHVLHCAASVAFDQPLAAARSVNVQGTRSVLGLAHRAPRLERFVHVSTAYVAGDSDSVFTEDDLDVGQGFRNTYEQSKLEAEQLVSENAGRLPIAVARPSIVVGEAGTGWTTSFNVLYPMLRAYRRGLIRRVPASPDAVVDVVTGDYVADSLAALLLDVPQVRGAYHLAAGEGALDVSSLSELAAATFGLDTIGLDPPGGETGAVAPSLASYLDVRCRFDVRRSRAALQPLGIRPAPIFGEFAALVAYAERSAWGKRPEVREQAPPLAA